MPVLGHAFTGLAMGLIESRSLPSPAPLSHGPIRESLRLPVIVLISYWPDIAAQAVLLTGWTEARSLTHSVPFGLLSAAAFVPLLAILRAAPPLRLFILTTVLVLGHDLLDLAQATDRIPLWPFQQRPFGLDIPLIPSGPLAEALIFGILFLAFGAARFRAGVGGFRIVPIRDSLILLILVAATTTHYLRADREQRLAEARAMAARGNHTGVLAALRLAERWPSGARPGRIDLLRGEAFEALGEPGRAEFFYLAAWRADPGYLWAVVDLANLYASSDRPLDDRRRLAAPWIARLTLEFSRRRELPGIIARIERKLGYHPGTVDPSGPEPLETKLDGSAASGHGMPAASK